MQVDEVQAIRCKKETNEEICLQLISFMDYSFLHRQTEFTCPTEQFSSPAGFAYF